MLVYKNAHEKFIKSKQFEILAFSQYSKYIINDLFFF